MNRGDNIVVVGRSPSKAEAVDSAAGDPVLAQQLWDRSLEMVGA
ncbi:hypothetical protein [Mycolicibacterium neworleansense]|nr:hypothetical protein [Mycolicibacterium neworleansense]